MSTTTEGPDDADKAAEVDETPEAKDAAAEADETDVDELDEVDVEELDEEPDGEEPDDEAAPEADRPLLPALGAVLGLTAIICIVLVAFGLPALKGGPHRVPIGLAGSPTVTAQLKGLFSSGGSDTFRVREFTSESALRTAIQDRDVYGGLVLGTNSASMLVASGASPTVALVLNSVASEFGAQAQTQIPVTDVVPLPKQDSRGNGLAAVGLPIVLAGILPGWLLVYRRFSRQVPLALAVGLAFSLVSGFAIGGILRFWFHSVAGNYPLISLALALGVASIAFPLIGLATIAGRIGVGIGTALMVLIGHPLSGLSTAPEWFPGFWGDLGQALPPGATGTLLRSTAFFSGRGSMSALIVLAAWIVGGLLLVVVGTLLNPGEPYPDDDGPDDELDDEPERVSAPVAATL